MRRIRGIITSMYEGNETPGIDIVNYGFPDIPASPWRSRRRLGVAALLGLVAFTITPLEHESDESVHKAIGLRDSSVEAVPQLPFQPGHNKLIFTPMGSYLQVRKGMKNDRQISTMLVKTEFNELHCRDMRLYGRVAITLNPRTMLFVADGPLPLTSLFGDCFLDNQLTSMSAEVLTIIGAEPYQYVAHRKQVSSD